ncbi:MAG: efflux RND transporter permease subunit [Gemmatimonadota bacterium]
MSIRRPVAVAMIYVSVALLGIAAWRNIPVELLPEASFPQLTLSFSWQGASPETTEAFATAPIEASIQQVRGVERITSTTNEGAANIVVRFARDTDMEFARMDLSERIASLEETLPDGVSAITLQPYVPREFEAQASQPFLSYTFTGPLLLEALRDHLDRVVVPEVLQIRGVAGVEVDGGSQRVLEIELDPDKIAALGLRPEQVAAAVRDLDLVRDVGAVREGEMEWVVTIRSRPTTAEDLRTATLPLPQAGVGTTPVRLEDVGEVRDTFQEPTQHFRISGSPAVGFRVVKEYGTNTVALSEIVRDRIAGLEAQNPPGSRLILISDASEEIERQLTDLRTRAFIAAGVIFLVLLLFLRSFRTAGIVFATIAFSILISLNLIYFGGLTLNILTLMGLALGFGLIVDNSIVVLENIFRQWQEGVDPAQAAEKGARDVVLPIFASTLTTLIVFLPFLYLQGELRIYYLPLAIVVGLTLIASIFVAFTFIPALAARLLGMRRHRALAAPAARAAAPRREPLYVQFYSGLLGYSLRFPWVTVLVAAACFGATYWLFDQNVVRGVLWGGSAGAQRTTLGITVTMPRGSDLERIDELTRYFEERLAQMPEVERFESRIRTASSTSTSSTTVWFRPELELTAVPLVIQEQVIGFALGFTGVNMSVRGQGPGFSNAAGGVAPNYRITILGYNYERLAEIAEDLAGRLRGQSRIREVDANSSAQFSRDRITEFVADINRDVASRYGVTIAEAASLIQAFMRSGANSGRVTIAGDPVDFVVRLEGFRQVDVEGLLETVVATPSGIRIPLGSLISLRERSVLTSIRREDQQYERSVSYEFQGPRLLGDLVRDQALEATVLPAGYSLRDTSTFLISTTQRQQMMVVLFVALGLIFMVTAALFESIRQPLVVLLAVPMALIGVFLIFFFVGTSFTREAYIGVIMMGGIVVNNAILLVDHINRVRAERGELPLGQAIVQATLERVRPILMTTATTVLGLLPLVLFMPAADARIWNALTYALIGGLLSSTLFVLTTTPALYFLFERRKGGAGEAKGGKP